MSAVYKKANEIRMKLLLFIDNEISLTKHKNTYSNQFIKKEHKNCLTEINFEETFCHSYKNETHFISSTDDTTNSKCSFSFNSSHSPNKNYENYYQDNQKIRTNLLRQKNEDAIFISDKKYRISSKKKISSVFDFYENEKNSIVNPKQYLQKLSSNLINKKKQKTNKRNKYNKFHIKITKSISKEKKLNIIKHAKKSSYFFIDMSSKNKIFEITDDN